MHREYNGVDLLDLYRGTLSARKLLVLIRHLSDKSALVRALNGGQPRWNITDHLVADLWALTAKAHSNNPERIKDHPVREEMQARERAEARAARAAALKAEYRNRKRRYE